MTAITLKHQKNGRLLRMCQCTTMGAYSYVNPRSIHPLRQGVRHRFYPTFDKP